MEISIKMFIPSYSQNFMIYWKPSLMPYISSVKTFQNVVMNLARISCHVYDLSNAPHIRKSLIHISHTNNIHFPTPLRAQWNIQAMCTIIVTFKSTRCHLLSCSAIIYPRNNKAKGYKTRFELTTKKTPMV